MGNKWLVVTGSVCLALALIEAWMLVIASINPEGGIAKRIPGTGDLLKSHIDYLLMSLFLYGFYLLFKHFQLESQGLVVFSLCLGSLGNPALFLVRAVTPSLKEKPTAAFRLMMGLSCVLTTVGYSGGAWLVARSALAAI